MKLTDVTKEVLIDSADRLSDICERIAAPCDSMVKTSGSKKRCRSRQCLR